MIPQEGWIGAFQEVLVAGAGEQGPHHEGGDRRLRAIEPGVVAGDETRESCRPRSARRRPPPDCPARDRGRSDPTSQALNRTSFSQTPKPPNFRVFQKRLRAVYGRPFTKSWTWGGVPGDHIVYRLQGLLNRRGFGAARSRRRAHRPCHRSGSRDSTPFRLPDDTPDSARSSRLPEGRRRASKEPRLPASSGGCLDPPKAKRRTRPIRSSPGCPRIHPR